MCKTLVLLFEEIGEETFSLPRLNNVYFFQRYFSFFCFEFLRNFNEKIAPRFDGPNYSIWIRNVIIFLSLFSYYMINFLLQFCYGYAGLWNKALDHFEAWGHKELWPISCKIYFPNPTLVGDMAVGEKC